MKSFGKTILLVVSIVSLSTSLLAKDTEPSVTYQGDDNILLGICKRLERVTHKQSNLDKMTEPLSQTGADINCTVNEVMKKISQFLDDQIESSEPTNPWQMQTNSENTNHNLDCAAMSATASRFIENQDGTVTDKCTKLMWLKDAGCLGKRAWVDVDTNEKIVALVTKGVCDDYSATYDDWRLPELKELLSLIDYSKINPALEAHLFSDIQSNLYWSATPYADDPNLSWIVNFNYGNVNSNDKNLTYYVWPVRNQDEK